MNAQQKRVRLRVGLIGSGNMASVHQQGWLAAQADVVAVYGVDSDAAAALAGQCGATVTDALGELLAMVDVVDICTPTHTHAEYAIAAAEAGRDVVCEKPLARTPEDAAAVVEACREAGVRLLVGQVVRFFPEYAAAKSQVDSGVIGDPSVIRLSRLSYLPSKGHDNWFHDLEKSGGLVYDLMIHDFDYARWIAGEVKEVFCKLVSRPGEHEAAAHAMAILRHDSGTLTHVEGSWMYPRPTFWTKAEIAGSKGLVSWDSERDAPMRLRKDVTEPGAGIPAPRAMLAESPWTTEIKHFAEVLRGNVQPLVTGDDGLAAVRISEAALQSIQHGTTVEVQR